MSRVYVTDFEAGTFAGQAAWPKGRNATLVSHFRQRIILVHKLGQLGGTKKLFDGGGNWLGIDQILGHQALRLGQAQTLFNGSLNSDQAQAEGVFGHFTHRPDATITQVVNIVHHVLAVANINQALHDINNVFVAQGALTLFLFATETTIELHPTYRSQIITLW